jgi:uncharacterized protein involved in exopolysaccharide biosynthesis
MAYSPVDPKPRTETPPDFEPYLRRASPEPPRVDLWDAIRSGWFIVLALTLVAVAAAAALALRGGAEYTAKSQLAVAPPDLEQPGALTGFSDAAQGLASSYSRSVSADAVLDRTARATGLSRAQVRSRVDATSTPESPVFRISATGDTPEEAARLANAATAALVGYVRSNAGSGGGASGDPLEAYREAAAEAAAAGNVLDRVKTDYEALPTATNRERLETAQTEFDVADLRATALRESYLESGGAAAALVRVESEADSGTAVRDKTWQKYVFAAGVAGLLIGLALAMLRAQSIARRRYAG